MYVWDKEKIFICEFLSNLINCIMFYFTIVGGRRWEVRRIRSGASQDRPGDVVWLDFMAPHRHLVDLTVTSACSNTNVPRIGARLSLHGSLALGAQHGKLDADLRTSALLGTPSAQSIHD
jgi:hypothetical protein